MADHFCTFLDFRPPTTKSSLNLFFLPSKCCYATLAHSLGSKIKGLKRRPLHGRLLSRPSFSKLDVISTHEHPDGSLLFRFGDPSEVAKNKRTEESNAVKKAGIEAKDGNGGVKDLDINHAAETVINKEDRGVTGSNTTEVCDDETNSTAIGSESVNVVEGENVLNEDLSGSSNDIELLVSIENENPSEVEKNVRTEESDSNGVEEGAETEGTDEYGRVKVLEKYDGGDVSTNFEGRGVIVSSFTEVNDKTNLTAISSKRVDVIEGETDLSENLLKSSNDIVTELPVSVTNEEMEVVDKGSEEENTVPTREFSENETDGLATLVSLVPGLDVDVPDNDVVLESLERGVSTDESLGSEHKNVETEVLNEISESGRRSAEGDLLSPDMGINSSGLTDEDQNLQSGQESIIGKGSGSDINDHMAPDVPNVITVNENGHKIIDGEAEPISNSMAAEGQASGAGTELPSVIDEDIQESDKIQPQVVSPQMEAEPILEATGTNTMEESTGNNGTESRVLIEASAYEVMGTESAESPTRSEEISKSDFVLSSGAALLPHPSKVLTGEEDAYFIADQTWLGVADGVGHWSLEGTHPTGFAKELTRTCERLVSDCKVNNLVELLDLSVAETQSRGSSTILIAHFDGQALHVANVGDSGFIVLRHGTMYKKSLPMFHAFHFPLHIERGDEPSRLADFYRVDLEESNVVIIGTDGLLDNLYDQEISSIVNKSLAADKQPEEIAKLLAEKAQEVGGHAYGRSPFADDAQAAGYTGCTGGKLDDVAVIVSVIRRRQSVSKS